MKKITLEALHEIAKGTKEDTEEIKDQVIKINSRVNKLEVWRGVIVGGLAVLTAFVLPIIIPIILKVF